MLHEPVVYPSNVGQIGLLGGALAQMVIHTYGMLTFYQHRNLAGAEWRAGGSLANHKRMLRKLADGTAATIDKLTVFVGDPEVATMVAASSSVIAHCMWAW